MKKILIIQTAFLGDVILATAAVNEANRLFPDAKIDVLVKKGNEALLDNNPKIHAVFTLDKSKGKWKEIKRLTGIFRKTNYDLCLNFHRFGSSGIITMLSGARQKYGFKKNPFSAFFSKKFEHNIGNGTHEVARNLVMLKEFGGREMANPELFPSQENFEKVKPLKSDVYFCLAPASVWKTKQLPEHKWIELIKTILPQGKIYLLGAKNDITFCSSILNAVQSEKVINLAGQLSFLESAALMRDAKRNFVNDSGPLHIASAMNAPVTAFFCSTVPAFGFGPLSDDSEIKEVLGLECRPCGLHGFEVCPKGHFKCGEISIVD